jgi:hypothetical protein
VLGLFFTNFPYADASAVQDRAEGGNSFPTSFLHAMGVIHRLFHQQPTPNCALLLEALLTHAKALGLRPIDAHHAQEMLRDGEPALCFDILANQLHSYDLEITPAFYEQLATVGRCLRVDPSTYRFNQALIRSPTHIPQPVQQELARLLASLSSTQPDK